MLKMLMLPLNNPQSGGFSPKVCIFGRKFSDKLKLWEGCQLGWTVAPYPHPCQDATPVMRSVLSTFSASGKDRLCRAVTW